MLLRPTDPFREFDRLAAQLTGTTNRPAVMPMDAWREGDRLVLELDLPGISTESLDIDVERNVLTVRAERVARNGDWERIEASYDAGVLRLVVPVAEKAEPRRIEVAGLPSRESEAAQIEA